MQGVADEVYMEENNESGFSFTPPPQKAAEVFSRSQEGFRRDAERAGNVGFV
jgi:hypothetical protein